jgi:hypothetical protein
MTTHLNLVPRSRMSGAICKLPNTSSWRGAYLSKGITLHFSLPFSKSYNVHAA